MQRHPDYTRARLQQFGDRIQRLIYAQRRPVDELLVSERTDRISYAESRKLRYKRVKPGAQFGPGWATFWFKAKTRVPREWAGRRVDLLWDSHSEATLWVGGRTVQGLNHEPHGPDSGARPDAVLLRRARGGETIAFDVEMACNRMFGKPSEGPFRSLSPFVLDQCDIALFDAEAWDLYYDFLVLQELEADAEKGLDKTWAGELLSELNRVANICDLEDRATWPAARKILKALYGRRNGTLTHELSAIGHAHIDTAWLWPLGETYRKCERTFSSQTTYMDAYPEHKFACSQACQYAMMKEKNPALYARIRAKVKRGQFVPVGGTWVEPDCNIPSGEALARQFLHGQRFFQKEFGIRCREFWNPDVFGYNGQLPQLMRLAGITRFLTQKLSWNRFNKPHHHTFTWQGIDGSEVLAHFPPLDTYNALATVAQLRENARNYKDHDRSRHSYLLFGFGDGGGGPTKRMLEMLRRCRDLEGVPRTQIRSAEEFFTLLEDDCTDRPLIIGELYFEYHRGTYTTQASTKRNNRKNEFLLHEVEFLSVLAGTGGTKRPAYRYPAKALDRLWKLLLLNQFHDILPGSSITLVYQDTERQHAEIRRTGETLRSAALEAAVGRKADSAALFTPVNTIGFARSEVARQPDGTVVFIEAPSYGVGAVVPAPDEVRVTRQGERIVLENRHLKAVLTTSGTLESLVEKESGREALSGPGNVLQVFDDNPTSADAWDVDPFHLETVKDCPPAEKCRAPAGRKPLLRAEVVYERRIGAKSKLKQTVRLDAGARRLEFHTTVDWQESRRMLKAAFPVNARAMNATYEMQFGCVERPTHYNTPYDLARYEVPGHKWADLSETGFGVALLTDSKYGYSTYGNTMRISLLRASTTPDPVADRGKQTFAYAIMPHAGGWREGGVVAEGYRFNVPVQFAPGAVQPRSLFSVDQPNVVLDTVKKAEDSDAIVVRLYEAHGARGTAKLACAAPFKKAVFCNILEEEGRAAAVRDGCIAVPYTPFQIVSLKLK
ncbi:MAG: glycosyl hydrolase-related protein [Planctomycetota bacterium]|nr:glycosyl hydrolase-related protein [Planctomycetota bacterium]